MYFDAGLVLTEKGIYTGEIFNGLPPQEQSLSLSGMEQIYQYLYPYPAKRAGLPAFKWYWRKRA